MKRGFTLIELLAVIVILAIIALITTPIVLNIISDSKESASLRSAEMYLKVLETTIATSTLNNKKIIDGIYPIINNGNICLGVMIDDKCNDEETLKIEINGEIPDSGKVVIENRKIKDVILIYGDEFIIKDDKKNLVYAKTLYDICTYDKSSTVAEKTAGSKYSCEVKPGTRYNFYVLTTPNEGDKTINLIMDRNICEDGTPATSSNTCLVAYNSSGDSDGIGPVTAIDYLNNATSTWKNIPNLNLTYDDEGKNFTGFQLIGKARMPYYSEALIVSKKTIWLIDYLHNSLDKENDIVGRKGIIGIAGYWTLSSSPGNSNYGRVVDYLGNVSLNSVGYGKFGGVRPVITLKL